MTRSGNLISKLQSSSLISLCWPVFPAVSPRPPSEWVPPEASLGTPDWAPWCRSRNSSENIPVSRKLQGVTWKFTSQKIISIHHQERQRIFLPTSCVYLNKRRSGLFLHTLSLWATAVSLRLLLHQPQFLQFTFQFLVLSLKSRNK